LAADTLVTQEPTQTDVGGTPLDIRISLPQDAENNSKTDRKLCRNIYENENHAIVPIKRDEAARRS
jgi:hypothetical protein